MGNVLGRDIAPGECVVVSVHIFHNKQPLENRIFTCESGEGMLHASSGREIYGSWLGGEPGKIYGYWIDVKETGQLDCPGKNKTKGK